MAPVDRAEVSGPEITDDEVVFRLPDAGQDYDGVRLEVDLVLGGVDPEFVWAAGTWSLRLPRRGAWRLEYQLTIRRGGDYQWTTDPGNPRRVPNPFGDKSEVRFPDYREPAWLMTPVAGPVRKVETSTGRLTEQVPVQLWSPAGLSSDRAAPLLLVHDGSDLAQRGSLLSCASAMSSSSPVRVALLDPAAGLRNEWYAAVRTTPTTLPTWCYRRGPRGC